MVQFNSIYEHGCHAVMVVVLVAIATFFASSATPVFIGFSFLDENPTLPEGIVSALHLESDSLSVVLYHQAFFYGMTSFVFINFLCTR